MDQPLVSATQVELFETCQRRWGFKYLDRIEVPVHPAAALGTEVQDTQIDPYLAEGREFDFTRPSGEIANALRPLLMAPKTPGLRLRRKFLMPSPSSAFAYQGEFDLWAPDSACVPGLEGGRPLLGDIKTTGNLTYAKNPATLAKDVQAVLYATDVMVEDGADELDLVWFYSRTKGARRAQREHLRVGGAPAASGIAQVSSSQIVEQFGRIDEIATKLVAIKLARPKVEDLPPTVRACDLYPPHGCPYRHKCNLSPAVQAAAVNREALIMNQEWLDKLRKGQAAPVAPVPPAATDAAIPLPPWANAPVDPLHARQPAAPPVVMPSTVAINPPESALPPAPPVGVAPPASAPAAAPARRGRPPKQAGTETGRTDASAPNVAQEPRAELGAGPPAVSLGELETLVDRMRKAGVKRLALMDGKIYEIALFDSGVP